MTRWSQVYESHEGSREWKGSPFPTGIGSGRGLGPNLPTNKIPIFFLEWCCGALN